MVAVLEALRDALLTREESSAEVNRDGSRKVDRRHFERPEWLLEEVINGYQFSTACQFSRYWKGLRDPQEIAWQRWDTESPADTL